MSAFSDLAKGRCSVTIINGRPLSESPDAVHVHTPLLSAGGVSMSWSRLCGTVLVAAILAGGTGVVTAGLGYPGYAVCSYTGTQPECYFACPMGDTDSYEQAGFIIAIQIFRLTGEPGGGADGCRDRGNGGPPPTRAVAPRASLVEQRPSLDRVSLNRGSRQTCSTPSGAACRTEGRSRVGDRLLEFAFAARRL